MRYVIARRSTPEPDPPATTALGQAAALLGPGQSLRYGTITEAVIEAGDGASLIMYGSGGVYDPIRKEVGFIGKRNSNGAPYRWLVLDETTDVWSSNRAVWPGGQINQTGHGYDHNACDPATGRRFHRPYNSTEVQVWDDTWLSSLPSMPGGTSNDPAAAITWVPGVGLVYSDNKVLRKHAGTPGVGSWTTLATLGAVQQNHTVSEYNPNSEILIFGGGNITSGMRKATLAQLASSSLTPTTIATPPFNCGSSETQGLIAHDPDGDGFVIWQKESFNWAEYIPGSDDWETLTQSSGNGSSPQNGTPNIDDVRHTINIPIPAHRVIMYVQYTGSTADVWLYRHGIH